MLVLVQAAVGGSGKTCLAPLSYNGQFMWCVTSLVMLEGREGNPL